MDDIWTIIAVVWLLAWLLAAVRVVKTNHDLWAGIGGACLGVLVFSGRMGIQMGLVMICQRMPL